MAATAARIAIGPGEPGLARGSRGDLRIARRPVPLPVPVVQDPPSPTGARCRARTRPSSPRPDQLRPSRGGRDLGPRRLPRRRARRLVRRRAAHRLSAPARHPRPLGRPRRGPLRPRRLGRHLLRDPRRLSPPRRQPRPRPCRHRLRPRPRRPRPRGLSDDHRAGEGDHLGRALPRQPQHLRGRRLRRGQPPVPAPRR